MKRICALVLVLLILAGCSRQNEPAEIPATEIPRSAGETALPEITQPQTIPTVQEDPPAVLLPPETDDVFVRVLDYIPSALQELMYATQSNFTGQAIYDFEDAYLRWGTVKKLQLVCKDLEELGLYIKIWDVFRPVSAQFALWEVCPDPTYVANPNKGHSSHSRGNTIDLTLVDANGIEVEMPTGFDDFSPLADRNYSDCTETAANNARILELIMEKHGFQGYFGEWWHYSDTTAYPVEYVFEP